MACQETVTLSLLLQLTRVSEPVILLLHVTKVSDYVYLQPDCWERIFQLLTFQNLVTISSLLKMCNSVWCYRIFYSLYSVISGGKFSVWGIKKSRIPVSASGNLLYFNKYQIRIFKLLFTLLILIAYSSFYVWCLPDIFTELISKNEE